MNRASSRPSGEDLAEPREPGSRFFFLIELKKPNWIPDQFSFASLRRRKENCPGRHLLYFQLSPCFDSKLIALYPLAPARGRGACRRAFRNDGSSFQT
jgi:hypothetical protein